MVRRPLAVLCALLPLAVRGGEQSVLTPQGPGAHSIAALGWIMFGGAALIFLLVMVLSVFAMLAPPSRRRWLGRTGMIVGGGIVFPIVTLSALLVYGLRLTEGITASAAAPLRIEIVGEQWWWRVRYLDGQGEAPIATTANEIHIPVGRPIEFSLRTADVIHSFWVPNLAGKIDMVPGHVNRLRLQATQPGTFRGQCAEYCGGAHALMAFFVIAQTQEEFDTWLAAQRRPAAEPSFTFLQRGKDLFLSRGCGVCHTVRGTPANGQLGPDLTHVGSRRTLAAGTLPNNVGTLAGWTAASQHLKPGNRMPSFDLLEGEQLRAIAAYLESLK